MAANVPPETPGEKIANLTDGQDDPNRGPLDRAVNVLSGQDDPNRGPIDRAENVIDGHDNPNKGPLDRTANAFDGHDDPNRGPLDRTANAITGGTGGVAAATSNNNDVHAGTVVSAVFDTKEEAQAAVAALRSASVPDAAVSLIAQSGRTTTTTDIDGDVIDEEHTSILRGILGGGALGAGLGVASLAIPGVGPLVAAGAIASVAVPGAVAIGAAAGAALGSLNEVLKSHGVHDDDIEYYGDRMSAGGTLVTVDTSSGRVRKDDMLDILHRHGGHNSSRAKGM